jgi:hypothetical protein
MSYESDNRPDEIHIYAASLTECDDVAPSGHVFASEQLSWFGFADQLPRYAASSACGVRPVRVGPRRP